MNELTPIKNVLFHYNKESHHRGFDSQLVSMTLEFILKNLQARGNTPRPYNDYSTRDLDISWRMQTLASHLKEALKDE